MFVIVPPLIVLSLCHSLVLQQFYWALCKSKTVTGKALQQKKTPAWRLYSNYKILNPKISQGFVKLSLTITFSAKKIKNQTSKNQTSHVSLPTIFPGLKTILLSFSDYNKKIIIIGLGYIGSYYFFTY